MRLEATLLAPSTSQYIVFYSRVFLTRRARVPEFRMFYRSDRHSRARMRVPIADRELHVCPVDAPRTPRRKKPEHKERYHDSAPPLAQAAPLPFAPGNEFASVPPTINVHVSTTNRQTTKRTVSTMAQVLRVYSSAES